MSIVTEIRHIMTCDLCGVSYATWVAPETNYSGYKIVPTAILPALWFKHEGALYCDGHKLAVVAA